MENVIALCSSSTRNYEQLTEKEKKFVKSKLKSLNYHDPISVIKFGAEYSRKVAELSSQMISRFRGSDFEDAKEFIVKLGGEMKSVDTDYLLKERKRSFFSILPIVKRMEEKRVMRVLSQQVSIENAIDEIEDRLVSVKLSLIGDIEFCRRMIKKNYKYAKKLELVVLTISQAINKAKAERLKLRNCWNKILIILNTLKRMEVLMIVLLGLRIKLIMLVFLECQHYSL